MNKKYYLLVVHRLVIRISVFLFINTNQRNEPRNIRRQGLNNYKSFIA
jgi:hypothetical protein